MAKLDFFDTAIRCVEETHDLFIQGYKQEKEIEFKGKVDVVTTVDKAIEQKVVDIIKAQYPDHDILAEELHHQERSNPYCWIIDPLDGTVNFAHNVPHFSLSIALEHNNEMVLGIVYNPILEELFSAEKGSGAFLNGKKISVSKTTTLLHSLTATGFPYDRWQHSNIYIEELRKIMPYVQGIRRDGVASLDLCYVACGRYDGFWERKLKPWDVSAAVLIIKEAGGKVTNYDAKDYYYTDDTLLATNKLIHQEMLKTLTGH